MVRKIHLFHALQLKVTWAFSWMPFWKLCVTAKHLQIYLTCLLKKCFIKFAFIILKCVGVCAHVCAQVHSSAVAHWGSRHQMLLGTGVTRVFTLYNMSSGKTKRSSVRWVHALSCWVTFPSLDSHPVPSFLFNDVFDSRQEFYFELKAGLELVILLIQAFKVQMSLPTLCRIILL